MPSTYRVRDAILEAHKLDRLFCPLPLWTKREYQGEGGVLGVGIIVEQIYVPEMLSHRIVCSSVCCLLWKRE
jgi:hypothetical protein